MISFFSGLEDTRATLVMLAYQFPGPQPTVIVALRMGEALGTKILPHPMLGLVMTRTECDMLIILDYTIVFI